MYNTNRMNITIELTDVTLHRIYCLAPVWNSTGLDGVGPEWINQSSVINVLTGTESQHKLYITYFY